ncbi:MAG: NYN domain-containing protein [Patescibacteria group bacterium]|nr:NYN domain-containing protein [Patescibacteria group bacterium]
MNSEPTTDKKSCINIAYIDATNLDKALRRDLGWTLDYKKFRVWLREKYKIERAYVFIGHIPKYKDIYDELENCGFELIFKEVVYQRGIPKGNCDSDLLMKASSDYYEGALDKAVIVASDGDYAPLVKLLHSRERIETILSPNDAKKCSILLKRTGASIAYINDQRSILEKSKNEKAPDGNGTS